MPNENYTRYTGKHALLSYNDVTIGSCYDCTVEITIDTEDATAWGDDWKVPIPNLGAWRMTSKKYATQANIADALVMAAEGAELTSTIPLEVKLYREYNDTNSLIFQGKGFCTRGSLTVPKGLIDEEFEITGVGPPIFIP